MLSYLIIAPPFFDSYILDILLYSEGGLHIERGFCLHMVYGCRLNVCIYNDDFWLWYARVLDASYVHAHGIITNPLSEIETLCELHGVKKSTHFCIWVDRVRIEKLSDTLYLARFDKWEKSGEVSMRQDCWDSWFHGEIYNDPSTTVFWSFRNYWFLLQCLKFLATSAFMLYQYTSNFGSPMPLKKNPSPYSATP